MTDYLLLEVYAHDVQFDAALGSVVEHGASRTPYALAFQFLDYPLLLTYARPGPTFGSGSVIQFSAGKSCVLQEEAEELQFVLEKVRLCLKEPSIVTFTPHVRCTHAICIGGHVVWSLRHTICSCLVFLFSLGLIHP